MRSSYQTPKGFQGFIATLFFLYKGTQLSEEAEALWRSSRWKEKEKKRILGLQRLNPEKANMLLSMQSVHPSLLLIDFIRRIYF